MSDNIEQLKTCGTQSEKRRRVMTDEQINAAITEATGLWDHPYSSDTRVMMDFCWDLNAMHEAEAMLSNANMYVMEVQLKYVLSAGEFYFHATARQHAEAFLRTLGRWRATDKESLTVGAASTEQSSADHVGGVTQMMKEAQK